MQVALQDLRTQAVQTLDSEFNIMEVVVSSLEVTHLSFIPSYCSQAFAPCYLSCMHACMSAAMFLSRSLWVPWSSSSAACTNAHHYYIRVYGSDFSKM
jgi:hypothetical protein